MKCEFIFLQNKKPIIIFAVEDRLLFPCGQITRKTNDWFGGLKGVDSKVGTIGFNLNVTADNIFIGNNVTTNRDEGPVVVENGKSIISYTSEVIIENNFEVKQGASLEIRKSQ